MTGKKQSNTPAVGAAGPPAPQVSAQQLVDAIKHVATCVRDIAGQQTEQARIAADARKEIERVHAVRNVLMSYLDRSFDERRHNFEELFTRLDRALESDNVHAVAATLDAIVKIADSSPFKALKDIQATQKLLKDKSKEWDL